MVAYSPNFCLPCQEGTDDPCDFADIWCEFVNKVDAQLDTYDSALMRTAEAIPIASVSTDLFNAKTFFTIVNYSIVDVDTDEMVDLTVSSVSINPSRDGVYMALARVHTNNLTSMSDTDEYAVKIDVDGNLDGERNNSGTSSVSSRFGVSTRSMFRWSSAVNGAVNVSVRFESQPEDVTVDFTLYWVCDL